MRKPHPRQPVVLVEGVARFKENTIVQHLLRHGGIDLNALALMKFPREDREQFAQLIGYSVSGAGALKYVSDATFEAAQAEAEALFREKKQKARRRKWNRQ